MYPEALEYQDYDWLQDFWHLACSYSQDELDLLTQKARGFEREFDTLRVVLRRRRA